MTSTSKLLLLALAPLFLAAGGTQAQDLTATLHIHTTPGYLNYYFVSVPYSGGIPDVANSDLHGDHCVGPTGMGDGVINADDVICDIWGSGNPAQRVGSFILTRFDPDTCVTQGRAAWTKSVAAPVRL